MATGRVDRRENRNRIVNTGGLWWQLRVLAGRAIPGFCTGFSGLQGHSIYPVDGRHSSARAVGAIAGVDQFRAGFGDARYALDEKLEGEKTTEKQSLNVPGSA